MKYFLFFLALASQAFAGPQIILLKLDDVIARRVGTKPVSDRWLKVHDYLIAMPLSNVDDFVNSR